MRFKIWNYIKFLIGTHGSVLEIFEPKEDMDLVKDKIKEVL